MCIEGEERRRREELLGEGRRQQQQQELTRANRNRFYLDSQADILQTRTKEDRADQILFLDSQVGADSLIIKGTVS